MTSKIAWLHYLKKPFVLSMTMHLGILLLLVVFSQHFVPELPPVPDTLEAALVSRSSVNQLSNSASATTPPASSVPTPKPLPAIAEKPLTTPAPKKEFKEEKPIKNKVLDDKPKVEPIKKQEEVKAQKPKELKQETPVKTKEIIKKVEPLKKVEQPIKKEESKVEKTLPKKEKDTPSTPTKSELEKKSALIKAEKEAKIKAEKTAQAKTEKEAKEKADKLAQAKVEKEAADKLEKEKAEKEAKDKAEKLAQAKAEKEAKEKAEKEAKEKAAKLAEAKAKIASLNKNALDNEMTALKNAEKKEAQAKLLKAAQATSHNEEELANLIDKYTRQIQKSIKQQWNKPPNTEKLSATLSIIVFPDGEVRNIYVMKSSGNDAFDASIKAAINKASPLPVPKDNPALNEKFRSLKFNFGSED